MRALCFADRRPDEDPLTLIDREQPDVILFLGDLDRSYFPGIETVTHIPKGGVLGNHCRYDYLPELGAANLHLRVLMLGELRVGGFEGSRRYKPAGLYQYNEHEAEMFLTQLPPVDVLVLHSPPAGVNDHDDDAHQGLRAVRHWVDVHQPRVLLHGHTYPEEATMVRNVGRTRVEYVHGWRIVDL